MDRSEIEESGADESLSGATDLPASILSMIPGTFYSSTLPPERRIVRTDPGWAELLLHPDPESRDSPRALAELVHDDERVRVETEIRRSLERSGSFSVFYRVASGHEGPGRESPGRARWIWDRGHAVDEGDAVRVHGLLLDITELKSVEDRAVQGQRKEALGALAGSVAQEFNDLLTSIYGSLDLARVQTDDPRIVRDEIHVAAQAVKRARHLTEQLVSFTRARPQQPRVTDVNDLVKTMKPLIESVVGSSIRTVLALDPQGSKASFDAGLVEQAVMNLVLNAREAMEEEGGRLLVSTGDVVFDVDDVRRGDDVRPGRYATISVSDTGPGLDGSARHRIYEPFFTTKEGHSGLGLSAAFGIVRQSGGILRLRSRPGRGTRATIYLPAVGDTLDSGTRHEAPESNAYDVSRQPSRQAAGGGAAAESDGTTHARVLVVEDDAAVRSLLARILSRSGYDVVVADRAEEALELAGGSGPGFDLLLTDVVLPGMNGPELVRSVIPLQPEARILIVSGFPDDAELKQSGLPEGAVFLAKPFTIDELLEAVREALGRPPPRRSGSSRPQEESGAG